MYASDYFASRYFAHRYFPSPHLAIKPRYFYHGAFASTYFPDRYFPGDVVSVIPPVPPQQIGGPARVSRRLVVHGRLVLELPRPVIDARGVVRPAVFSAVGMLSLPNPTAELAGRLTPSNATAQIEALVPLVSLQAVGVVTGPKRPKRVTTEANEDYYVVYYSMATRR